MSLKRVLSGAMVAVMIAGMSSVSAFAADSTPAVSVISQAPVDFSGNKIETLKAGDVFMLPIDVQSTDGNMDIVRFDVNYDPSILTPGIDAAENEAAAAYYGDNDSKIAIEDTTIYGGLNIVKSINKLTQKKTYFGTDALTIVHKVSGQVNVQWVGSSTTGFDVSTDNDEFFLFFTVNDGVSEISDLNADIVKSVYVVAAQGNPSVDTKGSSDYDGQATKLNACDGAFQIVIDSDDLPYYVKSVKANDTELTACTNEDGTTVYKFPVRLISSTGSASGTTDVAITAVVTDDEAGTTGEKTVSWGSVNVSVDGTATSYTDKSVTYNK
jgi:hypothetical protein